jgi:formylglycine-generating enzyme required for sulfatase activity
MQCAYYQSITLYTGDFGTSQPKAFYCIISLKPVILQVIRCFILFTISTSSNFAFNTHEIYTPMFLFKLWPCRPCRSLGGLPLCMAILFSSWHTASANNIQVGAPTLTGKDITVHFIQVRFDVSWDNSWRTTTHQRNWDAAWLFVKYRTRASYEWHHATLNYSTGTASSDGHIEPTGGTLKVTSGGRGAFLYASSSLSQQAVAYDDVELRWNYGADGLTDTTSVELKVFAIEMVYVPQGRFYLGTGGAETNTFHNGSGSLPYQVTSENALIVNSIAGRLWATGLISSGTLPATFPKGFQAFYAMKYELSQGMYADFLNTLTRTQQQSRVEHSISGSSPSTPYAMTNTTSCSTRNEIVGVLMLPSTTEPIEYSSSTPHVACNFLSLEDAQAYADWAGLRPMSELEYEKLCRGNDAGSSVTPVVNEMAWGDTLAVGPTSVSNSGTPLEKPGNSSANSAFNGSTMGPIRSGAWSGGSRNAAGAGWYGSLDLSGNLWEMVGNVAIYTLIPFVGNHGDGALDANGNSDVANWPYSGAAGLRGGSWKSTKTTLQVSDRSNIAPGSITRQEDVGFRAVCTAP